MTKLSFTKVEVDGFRGLRSLKLDDLGRVNIFVGDNNSGKTSVLEALSILCQPYNPSEWLSMIRRRDFGGLDENHVQSLHWCFTQATTLEDPETLIDAVCEFKCQGSFPLRELRVNYSEFSGEPNPDEVRRSYSGSRLHRSNASLVGRIMRGAELVHVPVWSEAGESNYLPGLPAVKESPVTLRVWEGIYPLRYKRSNSLGLDSETLTPYSYQINRTQVRSQSKLIFQDVTPSMLELLQDFDVDIDGIAMASFYGDRPAIYIKHRKLGMAPLSVFGDAMRRSVLLAATLPLLKAGSILLIDEVEVGIHVTALGKVFKWLTKAARELNIQIFVTTHSLEALDALISASTKQEKDDIVAFHLSQTTEGTQCKRFSGDLLHRLRFERGLDVR